MQECERLEKLTASAGSLRPPRDSVVAVSSHSSSFSSRDRPSRSRDPDRSRDYDRRASDRHDRHRDSACRDSARPRASDRHVSDRNHARTDSSTPKPQTASVECAYHRDILGQPGKRHSDADCRVKAQHIAEGRYHSVSAVICASVHTTAPPSESVSSVSPASDAVIASDSNPSLDVDDPAPAPPVDEEVPESAPVDDLVTTESPQVTALLPETVDSMPPADIVDPPALLQLTRKKYREYQDPELSTPRVQQERDDFVLTMLIQKAFQDPRPDDDTLHPGALRAFVHLRAQYRSLTTLRFIKKNKLSLFVTDGRIPKKRAKTTSNAVVPSVGRLRRRPALYCSRCSHYPT